MKMLMSIRSFYIDPIPRCDLQVCMHFSQITIVMVKSVSFNFSSTGGSGAQADMSLFYSGFSIWSISICFTQHRRMHAFYLVACDAIWHDIQNVCHSFSLLLVVMIRFSVREVKEIRRMKRMNVIVDLCSGVRFDVDFYFSDFVSVRVRTNFKWCMCNQNRCVCIVRYQ